MADTEFVSGRPVWVAVEFWDKAFRYVRQPDGSTGPPLEIGTAVHVVNRVTGEERRHAIRRASSEDPQAVNAAQRANQEHLEQWVAQLNAGTAAHSGVGPDDILEGREERGP